MRTGHVVSREKHTKANEHSANEARQAAQLPSKQQYGLLGS